MNIRQSKKIVELYNCFFITSTFNSWLELMINEECYQVLAETLNFYNSKFNSKTIAYVFMPNHIHLILYFEELTNLSDFMRSFKNYSSKRIREIIEKSDNVKLLEKIRYEKHNQKYKVWMDRFDSVIIKSSEVLLTKIKYIHKNPIKKKLVKNESDWKYSSANFYHSGVQNIIPIEHAGLIV